VKKNILSALFLIVFGLAFSAFVLSQTVEILPLEDGNRHETVEQSIPVTSELYRFRVEAGQPIVITSMTFRVIGTDSTESILVLNRMSVTLDARDRIVLLFARQNPSGYGFAPFLDAGPYADVACGSNVLIHSDFSDLRLSDDAEDRAERSDALEQAEDSDGRTGFGLFGLAVLIAAISFAARRTVPYYLALENRMLRERLEQAYRQNNGPYRS